MARHRQGPSVRLAKRGEYYYAFWTKDDGTGSDKKSLATKCPVEAQERYAEFLLKHGKPTATRPDNVRIDEVLARYWIDKGQHLDGPEQCRLAIKHLDQELPGLTVSQLTPHRIDAVVRIWRDKRGNANDTINRKFSVLRSALNYSVDKQRLDRAPKIPDLPKAPPRERVLTLDEMASFWAAIPPEDAFMQRYFLLLIATAARRGALMELQKVQIDFGKLRISLNPPGRKQNDKRRPTLPLAPVVVPWLYVAPDGYVCGYSPDRPLSISTLKRYLKRIKAEAGLEGVSSHTFRHSIATMLAEADVSEFEIARYGGWAWSKTTAGKYAHHRPDYLGAAVTVINDALKEIGRLTGRPIDLDLNLRSNPNRSIR